jgi:hypothetical protein
MAYEVISFPILNEKLPKVTELFYSLMKGNETEITRKVETLRGREFKPYYNVDKEVPLGCKVSHAGTDSILSIWLSQEPRFNPRPRAGGDSINIAVESEACFRDGGLFRKREHVVAPGCRIPMMEVAHFPVLLDEHFTGVP